MNYRHVFARVLDFMHRGDQRANFHNSLSFQRDQICNFDETLRMQELIVFYEHVSLSSNSSKFS